MVLLPSMAITIHKEPIAWGFLGERLIFDQEILD